MDYTKIADRIGAAMAKRPADIAAYTDLFSLLRSWEEVDFKESHGRNKRLLNACASMLRKVSGKGVEQFYQQWRKCLLFEAPHDLDSFLQYMELDRDAKKRFYQPRRRALYPVVKDLQALCVDDELDLLAISLPPGCGKALANDTPILTRNGWKNHGDLTIGDEVIGMDGKFKKVIAVHPKCQLDVLMEFTNGEKIQCHENHEWLLQNRHNWKTELKETKDWEKIGLETGTPGKRGHRYMLQVPPKQYVEGEHKDLPLDPYVFGVWLGDGATKNPRICSPKCDHAIIEEIEQRGFPVANEMEHKTTKVMYYDFRIRKQLQSMGMCHSRKRLPKYVPEMYFTADVQQRLDLLAGMLDTDGCLNGTKYVFSTTNPYLMDAMVTLVSTFGWRAGIQEKEPKVSSSGIKGNSVVYIVSFTPDLEIPCKLKRKQNSPRRQKMLAVKSITRVAPKEGNCITVEGGMYLAGKTLIPTHNTTLALFLLSFLAGREPNSPILTGSHSNAFIRGCYDEVLRMVDPNGEYLWRDVFPGIKVSNTNAKDCRIDFDKRQRFETLEFTSIGTGNAGLYRAATLLYCDDLVSGIEVALSKDRLDKLWEVYTTDLRQRKIGDHCKELHIATRWSVHDVIGRLEREYENDPRAKFIRIPAMNEADESNFDYAYGVGFNTDFYRKQREIMDDVSWRALYMNEPIEREGLCYHPDELRRYFELPKEEPDAIIGICDTKDKGADYAFLPVAWVYGQDYYIGDCVCDNGLPDKVDVRLADVLLRNKVKSCRFESNSAGRRIAEKIQEMVKERKGITHITTKYTISNKETRIIVNSSWVKEHCLFKDETMYLRNSDYGRMMNMLCSYTVSGRNKHDDVPDGMAMLAEYAQSLNGGEVQVFPRPF